MNKALQVYKNQGLLELIRRIIRYFVIKILKIDLYNIRYRAWLKKTQPNYAKLQIQKFEYNPKISLLVPVYNVEKQWLEKAVESVKNQIYTNWELCITDDASTLEYIWPYLQKLAADDERIKISRNEKNSHISVTTNNSLKFATGEWIGLLDNDDEYSPETLFEVVQQLNKNKDLALIYTDEDKILMNGKRAFPILKPDWSPETLMSIMFIAHAFFKKNVIDEIDGFRKGFEGSQDYDLVLRFTEKIRPDQIFHITKILYHWRAISGSTADSYSVKSYAHVAAKKALEETISRRNLNASVLDGLTSPSFRIKYEIKNNPKISILIPTRNRHDLVKTCIESIKNKTSYKNYEIILVDNNSDNPESLEYFETLKKELIVISYPHEFNFSAINNFAAKHASGQILLFLNNDTEVITSEWLTAMIEYAQQKEIGAVGALLLYPNMTVQHAGVILGIHEKENERVAGHSHKGLPFSQNGYLDRIKLIQNISAVTGACLMIRKSLFEDVGGFNEKDLGVAFNDIDLCLRLLQKGYRNVYSPFAQLYHYESLSRGKENDPKKVARFLKETKYVREHWMKYILNDPYYNPNLSRTKENFALRLFEK